MKRLPMTTKIQHVIHELSRTRQENLASMKQTRRDLANISIHSTSPSVQVINAVRPIAQNDDLCKTIRYYENYTKFRP